MTTRPPPSEDIQINHKITTSSVLLQVLIRVRVTVRVTVRVSVRVRVRVRVLQLLIGLKDKIFFLQQASRNSSKQASPILPIHISLSAWTGHHPNFYGR